MTSPKHRNQTLRNNGQNSLAWAGHTLRWGDETHVMAIINVTPDSFSGDGVAGNVAAALRSVKEAVAAGAAILDLGAESTRPGHAVISAEEELERLLPVLLAVRAQTHAIISVDTSKAEVAAAALAAGADMVNDIRGFTADLTMASVVAAASVPAVIMHDIAPEPGMDLLTSIVRELSRRLDRAVAAGVRLERLIVDPGFGFGKDWRQNLELLRRLPELRVLGQPVLVGVSRKSTIGRVLGLAESDRMEGTAATVALAIAGGADIVRVHDVRAMARVARMTDAVVRRIPDAPRNWPGGPQL